MILFTQSVLLVSVTVPNITNLTAAGGDGLPVVYFGARLVGQSATLRLLPADTSTGDYDGDGQVDAADYTVWRDTLNSEAVLAADGDENNLVDAGDYTVWEAGFGTPATNAVPEPGSGVLVLLAGSLIARRRKR